MDNNEKMALIPNGQERPRRTRRFKKKCFIHVLACCGLVAAFLDKLVHGSIFSLNMYINDLKSTFNYTQTETEIIMASALVGRGFSIVSGMFFDKFGPKRTILIAIVLTPGSYFLLWSSTKAVDFYKSKYLLVALYYVFAGFGSTFASIATLMSSLVTFGSKWRGKIIGVSHAFLGIGTIIFSQIYYGLFTIPTADNETDTRTPEQYDFAGFMLLTAISVGVEYFLCLMFSNYYRINPDISTPLLDNRDNRSSSKSPISSENDVNPLLPKAKLKNPKEECVDNTDDKSFLVVLKDPNYMTIVCAQVLLLSSSTLMNTNLTISSRSLGFSQSDIYLIPTVAALRVGGSLAAGILVDFRRTDSYTLLTFSTVLGIASTILYMLAGDVFSMFVLATILLGVFYSIPLVCVTSAMIEHFGTKHYGRNMGFGKAFQIIATYLSQYIFGVLYESQIEGDSIYCDGLRCIRYGYMYTLFLECLCFLLLIYRHVRYGRVCRH